MFGNGFPKKALLLISLLISCAVSAAAQADASTAPPSDAAAVPSVLPGGFENILLGMDIEDVKQQLLSDPNFRYRGEPDVTMLPQDDRQVIDCDGSVYIKRGYFQFDANKLYLITLVLDEEYIDHYSVFTRLSEKYGDPVSLNPSRSLWQNESVSISLERPLSIKYIDREVFNRLQQASSAGQSFEQQSRNDFLEKF